MQVKKVQHKRQTKLVILKFYWQRLKVFWSNALLFNFFSQLNSRFWGVAAISIMLIGFSVCLLIDSASIHSSMAFSDFGSNVRTAPYFTLTIFFTSYGLWRWRNYLKKTLKRTRPILMLLMLTIVGLYIVALMPISWKPWPYYIHLIGMSLVGISAGLTVIADILLSKTRRGQKAIRIKFIKMIAFVLIIIGGLITFASIQIIDWLHVSILGEGLMLLGYSVWIITKTRQGEEPRSRLSRILNKIVLVD